MSKKGPTQTLVEKHYIYKDSEFYETYYNYCLLGTVVYNQAIYQQKQRVEAYIKERKRLSLLYGVPEDDPLVKADLENQVKQKKLGLYSKFDLQKIIRDKTQPFYEHHSKICSSSSQILSDNATEAFKSTFTKIRKGDLTANFPHFRRKSAPSVMTLTTNNFNFVENNSYLEVTSDKLLSNNKRLRIKVRGHKRHQGKTVTYQQIKFKCWKDMIIVYVIYAVETPKLREDNHRYISIDLGMNRYATITNNIGKRPIIISSKDLTEKIRKTNFRLSRLQSKFDISKASKKKSTKQMQAIRKNLRNYQDTFEHTACNYIIRYCMKYHINTIVIGKVDFKHENDLPDYINKIFQKMSFSSFIYKLQYKANLKGLNVILVDESYTSGTSFLNCEYPNISNYKITRRNKGEFKSDTVFNKRRNTRINADVNASYQILKKHIPLMYRNKYEIKDLKWNPIMIRDFETCTRV